MTIIIFLLLNFFHSSFIYSSEPPFKKKYFEQDCAFFILFHENSAVKLDTGNIQTLLSKITDLQARVDFETLSWSIKSLEDFPVSRKDFTLELKSVENSLNILFQKYSSGVSQYGLIDKILLELKYQISLLNDSNYSK